MKVLVTGGSGYVGSHTVESALRAGHDVRTSVRDLAKAGGLPAGVEAVAADLMDDAGWAEAVAGCDAVLHVASPIPPAQPEDPDELVVPAREGTLRVLRAARAAGVRRVVLTSSFAAIGYGRSVDRPWNEDDWTEPSPDLAPYPLSKVMAERTAWDFVADGDGPELVVLNPTGIFGPVLGPSYGSTVGIVVAMLTGQVPAAPRQSFGIADVRDVAEAHLRALEVPEAAGRRFLLTSPPATSWLGMADVLRDHLGERAEKAPTREVEGEPVPVNQFDVSRARAVLGWDPRPSADTIVDTVESLDRYGLI